MNSKVKSMSEEKEPKRKIARDGNLSFLKKYDNLFPGEKDNKRLFLFHLLGALYGKHVTIMILGNQLNLAQMFASNLLEAFPPERVLTFQGTSLKDLGLIFVPRYKILFLTNFGKNRTFIEDMSLAKRKVSYGKQTFPKISVISVAKKREYHRNPLNKEVICIELTEDAEFYTRWKEFTLFGKDAFQQGTPNYLHHFLRTLHEKVKIHVPYISTLDTYCFNNVIPQAALEQAKFVSLIKNHAFFYQSERPTFTIEPASLDLDMNSEDLLEKEELLDEGQESPRNNKKDRNNKNQKEQNHLLKEIVALPEDLLAVKRFSQDAFIDTFGHLDVKYRFLLKFLIKWTQLPGKRPEPDGYYNRKEAIFDYIRELGKIHDLMMQRDEIILREQDIQIEINNIENNSKEKENKELKRKLNKTVQGFQAKKKGIIKQLKELGAAHFDPHAIPKYSDHTYRDYMNTLEQEYELIVNEKRGNSVVFRLNMAPSIRDFDYFQLEKQLKEECAKYLNQKKNA